MPGNKFLLKEKCGVWQSLTRSLSFRYLPRGRSIVISGVLNLLTLSALVSLFEGAAIGLKMWILTLDETIGVGRYLWTASPEGFPFTWMILLTSGIELIVKVGVWIVIGFYMVHFYESSKDSNSTNL